MNMKNLQSLANMKIRKKHKDPCSHTTSAVPALNPCNSEDLGAIQRKTS